ncbi:glucan endo-1 3-beta-glucosidas [Striga asiatica]|uniref:glucan endo-1,3-beta-D-glucosidase n=1 Tax=Striga asiatica TaxID=4170 RepID=A0A5A7Q3S2_STRAF|nr:glucan endo-1 3-beta-glucosidas [Striga asiatica]
MGHLRNNCAFALEISACVLLLFMVGNNVDGIGVNWGTQASHPLPPRTIVKLLKDNGIEKVKLFDADDGALRALSGSGIEVMVGIPNDMLATIAHDMSAAERWVENNVSAHISSHSVDIRYVAVGNEPFLSTYNRTYENTTFPALQNIQAAIVKAGLGNRVRATVPLNADVYQSTSQLPSSGNFRSDIRTLILQIVTFLDQNASPFTVNIYPFISLHNDPSFPLDYAFFDDTYSSPILDGPHTYTNVFNANFDTLVWALRTNGFPNMTIIVGEVGWPTDGGPTANPGYAQRFNQGFLSRVNRGTPMRPGVPINAYLFSLVDEDAKSIQPGSFERHWGIFYYDGTPKYNLSLGTRGGGGVVVGAEGVRRLPRRWCVMAGEASMDDTRVADSVGYACARADCTSLGNGSSCGGLDARGNISYAFNNYYQIQDQREDACRFANLSVVTMRDPSAGECRFEIMIDTRGGESGGGVEWGPPPGMAVRVLVLLLVLFACI